MSEAVGFFDEKFAVEILREIASPLLRGEIDLLNPALQRKVARLSVMRAFRQIDYGQGDLVEVFRRILPGDGITPSIEFVWTVNPNDEQRINEMRHVFVSLVGMEKRQTEDEVIPFLDKFSKERCL